MAAPYATVIVDTFNHQDFIENALTSVLNQTFSRRSFEIIVVDDGSTDQTPEILETFGPQIRLLRKPNGGQASAFNAAIPLAAGEIVAFLDGDDWWAPDKLSCVIAAFERDHGLGVVGTGMYEVTDSAQTTVAPNSDVHVTLTSFEDATVFRKRMSFFGTSRVAMRREVLQLVGAIPNSLIIEADEYMSTVAIAKSRALILRQPLTFYRLHSANLYQFHDSDPQKIRRKVQVLHDLSCELVRELPKVLPTEAVQALVKPIELEATCLRLSVDGGKRRETFEAELASMKLNLQKANWKYLLFKLVVLGITLILPPKLFYKARSFYAKKKLARVREWITARGAQRPLEQR